MRWPRTASVTHGLIDRHGAHMKADGTRRCIAGGQCLGLGCLTLERLRRRPVTEDLDVRGGSSWRPVTGGRGGQMFELTLLFAPTEGTAS